MKVPFPFFFHGQSPQSRTHKVDSHCGNTGATNSAPMLSTCVKSRRDGPSAILAADSTLAQIGAHDSLRCMQPDSSREHVRFWCAEAPLQQVAQDTVVVNEHEGCSAADDVLERRDEKEDSQHLQEVDLRVLPVQELVKDGWWGIKVCVVPTAPSRTPQRPSTGLRHLRLSMPILSSLVVWPTAKRANGLSSRNFGPPRALHRAGDMSNPCNGALAWAQKGFTKALPCRPAAIVQVNAKRPAHFAAWSGLHFFYPCHAPQLCCPSLRLVRIHRC